MKTRLLILTGLIIAVPPALGAQRTASQLGGPSRVTRVTLFHDRAFVTRAQRLAIPKGAVSVRFEGITPLADPDSLKVSVSDRKHLTLMGVRTREENEPEPQSAKVRSLEAQVTALTGQIEGIQDQVRLLIHGHENLKALAHHYQDSFALNIHQNSWTREQFRSFLHFLVTQSTKQGAAWRNLYGRYDELQKKLEEAEAQLVETRSVSDQHHLGVYVDLESDEPVTGEVRVQYLVKEAGWSPTYDLRLEKGEGKAWLESNALAWQKSGEDWDQVQLTLSNVPAELHPTAPQISRQILSYSEAEKVHTGVQSIQKEEKPIERDVTPGGAPDEGDAESPTKASTRTFSTDRPQTIRSGLARTKIFITRRESPFKEHLALVAGSYPYVFHQAELANPFDWELFAGPLSIYLDGAYVQQTWLEAVARHQAFGVNIGIDHDLRVERSNRDSIQSPGIIDRKKHYLRRITTQLENLGPTPKTVRVLESTPVSELDDVKVSTDGSTDGLKKDTEHEGWIYWQLKVPARKKEVVELKLDVASPADFDFSW